MEGQKRKRSFSDRGSPSPPPKRFEGPRVVDVDPARRAERERQLAAREAAAELEKLEKPKEVISTAADNVAEFAKLVGSRSGGVYLPPGRLREMQAQAANDKSSPEYQRMSWDALRKSITGIVNRVNVNNIKDIIPELFSENLIRGRGLFARSIMKAQAASLPFTPVFACMVAIVNTKLPQVGELVLIRLISQFRRAFKRNDKTVCHSSTTFIAHLVNQGVADVVIVLEILLLLLERPTDDSIEIAVGLTREVGAYIQEESPMATNTVFERFRAVLNEGTISHRVQYMIEVLMQVRKDKYKDNPIIPEGLDLVEAEEQIPHQIQLQDDLAVQEGLNIFKADPNFLDNEEKYKAIKSEILGEGSDDSDDSGSDESDDEADEPMADKEGIEDRTETNLVNLRRTIYLTIMNALNYEEAVHKLLKVQLNDGQEIEMVNMIIECCSQERSYSSFYGLIGERLSKLNRVWTESFEEAFRTYYTTIHRYETNRLRNIAKFFGHLFATDSITWMVMDVVTVTEDDTTSSSRIFLKLVFGEIVEAMGLKEVKERFLDPEVKAGARNMFPMDNPKNTRFSINYWTSIGLGVITEEMREWLKNAPKMIMEQRQAALEQGDSSDSDSSDTDSDTTSSSDSSDDSRDIRRSRRSPSPPRRRRSVSPPRYGRRDSRDMDVSPPRGPPPGRYRRSPSPPLRRGGGRGDSPPLRRSPPPPRRGGRDDSRSPPPRRGRERDSRSRTPPPRRAPLPPGRRDSTPPRRRYSPSSSRSRSPPRRGGQRYADSRSPSPPPPRRGRSSSSRSSSRSPPPQRRRASYSRSRTPPNRGGGPGYGKGRSLSPPPRRGYGRNESSSRSPEPVKQRRREKSPPIGGGRSRYENSNGGYDRR
ncbi:hypothetical protein DL96DRAFT_1501554 [Flagelloscypha sp. PMI_526]|nr:hypothetical protein DL96DRAFT_1501554 [Flagelloscypha sp. PMI_526]